MKQGRKKHRVFWVSLFSTLCVAALLLAFLETDYQCRRIGFGGGDSLLEQMGGKSWRNLLICGETKVII